MTVSILIPAFNAASYIEETLLSCVEQGEAIIQEIVVIDDHSEDNTLEVIQAFAKTYDAFRFIIDRNPSKGACSARNYAFSLASGEAIQWLDADDLLGPGKLEKQLAILKSNPNHLIASKWRRFSGDLRNLFPEEQGNWSDVPNSSTPLEWLASERMMIPAAWLGSKSLFESLKPWDERLLLNQDGEYFTRAIVASEGIKFESTSRVYYRSELEQSVSRFKPEKAASLFLAAQSFENEALKLGGSPAIHTLISNQYQATLYRVYPYEPVLRRFAERKIQAYGKPSRKNDVAESTIAKLLCSLVGWKILVRLRILRNKILR